jgi:hypothetical protein
MSLPDNRIRLSAPLIDFVNDVGETGKSHDSFPDAGQARYDHLRSYLIGLLSNQASYTEPTEFRLGSLWFDINSNSLKIRNNSGAIINYAGTSWDSLADAILLDAGLTLTQWYQQIKVLGSPDTSESFVFNKFPKFTTSEQIDAGKLVRISGNGIISIAGASDISIGVCSMSVDADNEVVVYNNTQVTMRMVNGLTLSPGDVVWGAASGFGTNVAGIIKVGVVTDASVYDQDEDTPVAKVMLMNL